jgi:hypothetical protein
MKSSWTFITTKQIATLFTAVTAIMVDSPSMATIFPFFSLLLT